MKIKLGDVCTFQSGGTPTKETEEFFNGTIPWITTTALNGGKIDGTQAVNWITEKAIEKSAAKLVPAFSIMVGTRVGVGKVAVNTVQMSTSQDIISLINIDENQWDKDYLCKYIQGKNAFLNSQARGATIKGIKMDVLANLELEEITLENQARISETIDRVKAILDARKSELLELDKLVKARFAKLFGDPVADSRGWGQVPLKQMLKSIRYGTSTPPVFAEDGYCFIRATNIKNGRIVNNDMKHISQYEADRLEKCKLAGGEVLIVRSGVNAGDTCVITDEYIGQYAGYDMILVMKDEMNPIFLNELINTGYMNKVVKPLTRRAAQPHLNSEQVQSFPIIKVPKYLQDEFADFVKQTNKSKAAVQKSLDETQVLFDSLMQKYFG